MLRFFIFFTLVGCVSLQEKKGFNETEQLRKIVLNLQSEIHEVKEEASKLRGLLEENNHKNENTINELEKKITSMDELYSDKFEQNKKFQNEQKEFNKNIKLSIAKNNKSVILIDQYFNKFRKEKLQENYKQELIKATNLYRNKKYKEAREIYLKYLNMPDLLTLDEYRKVLYRVSLAEFKLNMDSEAITHFSELYDKFNTKSDKYISSSLFHIALILTKQNKCQESRQIFEQIVLKYPKHKYFKNQSEKYLNKLNKTCKPLA